MSKYDEAPTVASGLIRLARAKSGLTQSGLGERAGVEQQVVSAYETGRREPTMPTLLKLLAAAGFDLRMRLIPVDDHDESLDDYLEELPEEVRSAVDERSRSRVAAARLRRIRRATDASPRS